MRLRERLSRLEVSSAPSKAERWRANMLRTQDGLAEARRKLTDVIQAKLAELGNRPRQPAAADARRARPSKARAAGHAESTHPRLTWALHGASAQVSRPVTANNTHRRQQLSGVCGRRSPGGRHRAKKGVASCTVLAMANGPIPGGLLIAVEGIDGAGKTTLAHALTAQFSAAGVPVNVSKEPTRGPWGVVLRESAASGRLNPQEELRLLLLDRRQHVEELIAPALARNEVVILDRYYPSTAAYQGASGLDVNWLLEQNAFAPVPDVVLLLDVDPVEGLRRIRARGDTPNLFETHAALTACRDIFLSMPLPTRTVIDASQSADDVQCAAWQGILRVAAQKSHQAFGLSVAGAEAVLAIGRAVPAHA